MKNWQKLLQTAIDNKMIIGTCITEDHIKYCTKARALFLDYNNRFYNLELPATDIFFSLNGPAGEYYSNPLNMWYNTNGKHSIVICPEEIETETDLKEVLLHEMAHEYCDIHDIEDMDGTKHTRKFAEVCLSHGLFYKDGETDYSNTIFYERGTEWK